MFATVVTFEVDNCAEFDLFPFSETILGAQFEPGAAFNCNASCLGSIANLLAGIGCPCHIDVKDLPEIENDGSRITRHLGMGADEDIPQYRSGETSYKPAYGPE
jgi:hypothetical protein